jgi:hypothetical protein
LTSQTLGATVGLGGKTVTLGVHIPIVPSSTVIGGVLASGAGAFTDFVFIVFHTSSGKYGKRSWLSLFISDTTLFITLGDHVAIAFANLFLATADNVFRVAQLVASKNSLLQT